MRLNIRELSGNTFSVDVAGPNETIEIVKLRIFATQDFHPCDQYLVYKNDILEDEQTLQSYGIGEGSKVNLVIKEKNVLGNAGQNIVIDDVNAQIDSTESAFTKGLPDGNEIQPENQPKSNKISRLSLQTRKAKEQQRKQQNYINIALRQSDGEETHFKVPPTIKVNKLLEVFCARNNLSKQTVQLIFDGQKMRPNETFAMYGVQEYDLVDTMVMRCGA
ncbi:MAG: hypothetical protein EZS28_027730 [Streblomastix strix]|uniref:Ubiquitin-like domain-containing protein n=1 Tax=Streblomastix strix TaxID=222440 RepID=A0A5J4V2L8_9EUKA|nr:MAG: hypothetical protein EZS28_027730 [Streblomastix strix]